MTKSKSKRPIEPPGETMPLEDRGAWANAWFATWEEGEGHGAEPQPKPKSSGQAPYSPKPADPSWKNADPPLDRKNI